MFKVRQAFRRLARKAILLMSSIVGVASMIAVTPAAATAQPLTKVRYQETIRSIMFTPAYIALARGYFKSAGLDVEMKTAQGTDKAIAALLTDSADIVLVGPEGVLYVANSDSPEKPKIISGLVASDGFLLVARDTKASPESFKWSQLKGKTVMAYRPGSTPDVFLNWLLREHKLEIGKDVKIINNIGPTARMGAWIAGKADYGIFSEPNASTIEREGHGRVVASDGHDVGPVDYTVFAAMPKYIAAHPQVIKAWTTAIAHGMQDAQKDSLESIVHDIASFFPGLSQAELVQSLARYRHYGIWKTSPVVEPSAISKLQDMLIADGELKADKRVAYDRVVVPELAHWGQ